MVCVVSMCVVCGVVSVWCGEYVCGVCGECVCCVHGDSMLCVGGVNTCGMSREEEKCVKQTCYSTTRKCRTLLGRV